MQELTEEQQVFIQRWYTPWATLLLIGAMVLMHFILVQVNVARYRASGGQEIQNAWRVECFDSCFRSTVDGDELVRCSESCQATPTKTELSACYAFRDSSPFCAYVPLGVESIFYFVPGDFTIFGYTKTITASFFHIDYFHLFGNMVFLLLGGAYAERRLRTARFLKLYLASALSASLFVAIISFGSEIPLLGASGAIAGVMAANLVLNYYREKYNEKSVILGVTFHSLGVRYVIVWILFNLVMLLAGTSNGISYAGHVGGFIAGLFIALSYARKDGLQVEHDEYINYSGSNPGRYQ